VRKVSIEKAKNGREEFVAIDDEENWRRKKDEERKRQGEKVQSSLILMNLFSFKTSGCDHYHHSKILVKRREILFQVTSCP